MAYGDSGKPQRIDPWGENPYLAPQSPPYHGGMTGLAGRGARLAAALIDGVLGIAALMVGGLLGMAMAFSASEETRELVAGMLGLVGMIGFNIWQWIKIAENGQSLGKRWMGIRIILNEDHGPPGFVQGVVMRLWLPGLIGNVPCVGVIFALVDVLMIFREDRRCLHDQFASTIVVRA